MSDKKTSPIVHVQQAPAGVSFRKPASTISFALVCLPKWTQSFSWAKP